MGLEVLVMGRQVDRGSLARADADESPSIVFHVRLDPDAKPLSCIDATSQKGFEEDFVALSAQAADRAVDTKVMPAKAFELP
jgi:hypothetical protein